MSLYNTPIESYWSVYFINTVLFTHHCCVLLYFAEKTLQQDMVDFFQGARGQDFHDITLMVDGEPIGAHKVRCWWFCCRVEHITMVFSPISRLQNSVLKN